MSGPLFLNEVIGSINGSNEPVYSITHSGGTLSGAKLTLSNTIVSAGTPLNADTMNKLVDFDNLDSYKGCVRKTEFGASVITEIFYEGTKTAAKRVTAFATGAVTETVTLYTDSGGTARETTVRTTFPTGGTVKIIEEVA